jgi:hypothetical protein
LGLGLPAVVGCGFAVLGSFCFVLFWGWFVCDALAVFFWALAFPCFVIGLLGSPLCGAALTFFAAAKKATVLKVKCQRLSGS